MALLFMDGFDAGDFALKYAYTSLSAWSSNTTSPYGSGRSIYKITNSTATLTKAVTASNTVVVGVANYFTTNYSGLPATIIELYTDAGASLQLFLGTGDANNTVGVWRGHPTSTRTLLFSAPATANSWHYYELKATIDGTSGSVELKIDGAVAGSFSGNTKNGGTSSLIDTVGMRGTSNNTGIYMYWDDMYVLNTTGSAPYNDYLGEIRIQTLTPNAAGSSTQFTPSAGANYSSVNEIPYSTANNVYSSTSGHRDTYALTDMVSAAAIYGVQNNMIARKTDANSFSIKHALKSGSTVYYGADITLTASDQVYADIRSVDPDTSVSWTESGVNALESGFEVV